MAAEAQDNFAYKPFIAERFCAFTFQNEKALPKGQKLLLCSKCREVFYVDRQAQIDHWPTHRKVCCSILDDDRRIRTPFTSIQECDAVLLECVRNDGQAIKGRLFLHAIQEYKRLGQQALLEEWSSRTPPSYGPFGPQTNWERVSLMKKIFSIPSFVNFFLSDSLLSTDSSFVDAGTKAKLLKKRPGSYGGFFLPATYVNMVGQILIGVVDLWRQDSSCCALSAAASRRLMLTWKNDLHELRAPKYESYRSKSDGKHDPNTLLILLSLMVLHLSHVDNEKLAEWIQPNELVPGLTAPDLLQILMNGSCTFRDMEMSVAHNFSSFVKSITDDNGYGDDPSKHIPVASRMRALEPFLEHWERFAKAPFNPTMIMGDQMSAFAFITGTSTKGLLENHEFLASHAARHGYVRSKALVREKLASMMDKVLPSLLLYIKLVEGEQSKRNRHSSALTNPPSSLDASCCFPEDLIPVIASFALPKVCGRYREELTPSSPGCPWSSAEVYVPL